MKPNYGQVEDMTLWGYEEALVVGWFKINTTGNCCSLYEISQALYAEDMGWAG